MTAGRRARASKRALRREKRSIVCMYAYMFLILVGSFDDLALAHGYEQKVNRAWTLSSSGRYNNADYEKEVAR